ncbi:MAG: hypothetical protein A3F80_07110 [Candidatus Melainabacteria bacterium RIFCSPLOWO2_12_FULL_35_11]|nr:MAG: hypothetical protein A3F80_07110 [Candidatus Melainabacteria bacterium RIFCSPLOWO2_12_FULL_35_11]
MNWQIIDYKFKKEIDNLPVQCKKKYAVFKYISEHSGLKGIGGYPGFKLEQLKGNLKGVYSVRLNIAYRVLFIVNEEKKLIEIYEVSKHEYNQ